MTMFLGPFGDHAAPKYPPLSDEKRSGLVYLRDAVEFYFQEWDIPATVAPVGLKYRSFGLNQTTPGLANRIVFIPGKFDGTSLLKARDYGSLSRETSNSASVDNPREIGAWAKVFTISVWSPPVPGQGANEESSTAVVDDLVEQLIRAVNATGDSHGVSIAASIIWGDVIIVSPPNEQSFGTELLIGATQIGPIFDRTLEVVRATPVLGK